jgi:hypothetical protein
MESIWTLNIQGGDALHSFSEKTVNKIEDDDMIPNLYLQV